MLLVLKGLDLSLYHLEHVRILLVSAQDRGSSVGDAAFLQRPGLGLPRVTMASRILNVNESRLSTRIIIGVSLRGVRLVRLCTSEGIEEVFHLCNRGAQIVLEGGFAPSCSVMASAFHSAS